MAHAISSVDWQFVDYNNEKSNLGLWVATLTAGNIVAQTTLINALQAAAQALVSGVLSKQKIVLSSTNIDGTIPNNSGAQRELKWLIRYHDASTGEKYTASLPTASVAYLASHSDMADPTVTQYSDFETAFNNVVASPNQANAVELESLQLVGRNL